MSYSRSTLAWIRIFLSNQKTSHLCTTLILVPMTTKKSRRKKSCQSHCIWRRVWVYALIIFWWLHINRQSFTFYTGRIWTWIKNIRSGWLNGNPCILLTCMMGDGPSKVRTNNYGIVAMRRKNWCHKILYKLFSI